MRIVFVLAPRVHLLDLAGPAQAFASAGEISGEDVELRYVAEAETVGSHQGLPLRAETSWPELGADDLVVVPGWKFSDDPRATPLGGDMSEGIRRHHGGGGIVMSVCSGAFALARAGLLDGRRATTHHELQAELARQFPAINVVRDVLFVGADRVYTSAGIASGIDLALHLVASRHGPQIASKVARTMVVYARRNGQDPQESVMLRHRDHLDELVHRAQDTIDSLFASRLPLAELASSVGTSERTLTRAFARVAGLTPLRYQQALRRERAELLIASGASIDSAARAVGFEDARMLRRLRHA